MNEYRGVTFEVKALKDDVPMSFEGYGAVFENVDAHLDRIAKGAFKGTLKEWKSRGKLPKLLLQHGGGGFSQGADDLTPIGKWDELREDDHGLYGKGHLFNVETDRVKGIYAAMQEGELDGLSIGYRTRKFKMDQDSGVRTLTEIDLVEVSLVTFPANTNGRVLSVKDVLGANPDPRSLEEWFRCEAGLSKAEARRAVHHYTDRLCEAGDHKSSPDDPVRGRVEGSREALIALRSALGVPSHGSRSQGADR